MQHPASSWANNYNLGVNGAVALAHDVTGLTGGTTYYFAFKGVNLSGGTGGTDGPPYRALPPLPR